MRNNHQTNPGRALLGGIRGALVTALALLLLGHLPAHADLIYKVVVDTSALPGGTTGILDFQFNPSSAGADAATAQISNFAPTSLTMGSAVTNGGGSGALPGSLTINNSDPSLNEVYQGVTFGSGSGFTFNLTLSGQAINSPTPGNPDGTSFFLGIVDQSFNPFSQFGGADPVLEIDINGGSGIPVIQPFASPPIVSVTLLSAPVPEPSSVVLLLVGSVTLSANCLKRTRHRRSA